MHKFGLINLSILCCFLLNTSFSPAQSADNKKSTASSDEAKTPVKTEYYNLVDPSIKPDNDEFYVKTIYKIKGEPRALIARSNNKRSGQMFNFPSEYNVGDRLSDDLKITDIVIKGGRKFIRVKKLSTEQNYILKISYGKARSRLILDSKSQKAKVTQQVVEGELKPVKN